ncbi:hypothetical protein SLEP1_g50683 [Rubroshorea leprosula]|uniref:Uncharacterized protein n=1 Tax=Rubroshorea leprosula TaxID=152421 RepID=A0AAV5M0U3_9ROSI|nr:hypothetical protein SLEP1_g50683 [Rubroshorea leprosula]
MVSNMFRLHRRSEFGFLVISHTNDAKVTDEASDTPAGTANDFRYNVALLQQSSATES